jgi:hypothetical protein
MKIQWLRAATVASTVLFFTCSGIHAQERDRRDDDRHDQDRRADEHRHFDDHDREALRDWYRDHSDRFEPGARGQRWDNEDIERHLQVDRVFDDDMRRWARPVPEEVASRLGPLPRDWRYMMIGYNICIVDRDWTIRDVFHFDQFNDHDRQVIQDWNRDHPDALKGILGGFGVRIDNGDLDRRLQIGVVVDSDLQNRVRPAPQELMSRLSVPPRDWRYVIIGDRLCLVDRDWRVHESFHFSH